MKKISLFIGAFALLVAATSSCSSGSNSEPEEPQAPSVKVDVNAENVVTLTSNVDATFTLGTQKVVGKKSATFTTIEKSVVVNVEAEGYLSQDVKVAFGESGAANVAVTLVKKSTNEVAQDEAKGSTVTNDAANQEATQDVASEVAIEVPADVTVEGSTDPFSITATPVASAEEVTVEEEVSEEKPQEVASPLVAVDCTPSGATFSSPVKLTVSNADIVSDYAFNCVYVKDDGSVEEVVATTSDGKVSADVNHFSTWTFNLIAQIVKKESGKVKVSSVSTPVVGGENTVSYKQKVGCESEAKGLLGTWVINNFGSKSADVTRTTTITSTGDGNASFEVWQETTTYTVKCGKTTISVKVYGKVSIENIQTSITTPGHSGGAGQ